MPREAEYGYQAVKHQRFVGTGYFDALTQVIAGGLSSTTALDGSTEQEQFAEIKTLSSARNMVRMLAASRFWASAHRSCRRSCRPNEEILCRRETERQV